MILSCQNICKTFVEKPVLQNISFHLNENDRLAIIGYNGAGKSTLLKILIGEISYDEGEISLKKDASIGYLAQHQDHTFHHTIFDELLSVKKEVIELDEQMRTYEQEMKHLTGDALEQKMNQYTNATHRFEQLNGFAYKSEITGILKGLGFSEENFTKEINTLSGGQRTRVALGKLLLKNPDILLLDEPTNHLDLKSINWLENFLLNFKNTVIVVSHDRHFLNKVCTHIADIDYSRIQLYVGNYDFWYEYSQMQIQQAKDQNKKAEAKKKELEEFIARFSANASKAKQATSRKKLLDNLEMVDIKPSLRRYTFIGFKPGREVGNIVLNVEGLTKVVDGEKLINNVSFSIQPNEKVAFVGDDKATEAFFKIIMGEDEDYEGEFKWGVTTSQSYFPKDNSKYFNDCELSLVDWLRQFTDGTVYEQDLRGWLGRVLFSGEEALKKANVLSGGEKVRCMLAKMMMEDANVLVFDEPTNHLDLESIQALNQGLIQFKENILFTCHDHQFVQTIANRIIEFNKDGMIDRLSTYDEYLEYKEELETK